jgi:hypothetical protein
VDENQYQNGQSADRALLKSPPPTKNEDAAAPAPGTTGFPSSTAALVTQAPTPSDPVSPDPRASRTDGPVGEEDIKNIGDKIGDAVKLGLRAAQELTGGKIVNDESHRDSAKELARKRIDDGNHIYNFYFDAKAADNDKQTSNVNIGTYVNSIDQRGSDTSTGSQQSIGDEDAVGLWSFDRFVLAQKRVPDIGYVLAVAALSGAPLSSINRAADDLAQRLAATPLSAKPDKNDSPSIQIATPRRVLLAEIGCDVIPRGSEESEDGYSSAERVRFREQGTEQNLLRDAWLNLRLSIPWTAPFLTWLSEYGRSPDPEMRLAAGRTVGLMATWDASAAEAILFGPWVSGQALDAVGASLIALSGTSPAAAKRVEKRLIEWTEGREGKERIIAAALLACGAFGHAAPDTAFRLFASLVRQKRHLTLDLAAMGYAVSFAAAADEPQIGARVIEELSDLRKSQKDKIIQKLTGAYFLLLTAALDEDKEGEDKGNDDSSETLFLDVIDASPKALQSAAQIFNELLAPNVHANTALERFRAICFCAFRKGARLQRTFLTLAEAMHAAGDEDQRDTLRYWLGHWSDDVDEVTVAVEARLSVWLENSKGGEIRI